MKITNRIILHTTIITFFSVIITTVTISSICYFIGENTIKKQAINQLISLREIKKKQVENYFNSIKNHISIFSNDRMIINAMDKLGNSFASYKDEIKPNKEIFRKKLIEHYLVDYLEEYKKYNGQSNINPRYMLNLLDETSFALQYQYILKNPHPIGHKDELDFIDDGTEYSKQHAIYHKHIKYFKEKFGYYDILLVDHKSGDIVYSVSKELDFTTSLIVGPYSKSNIGKVFQQAKNASINDFIVISDYEPYLPSYDKPSAFIGSPIFNNGIKVGVLIFQLPKENLNNIVSYDYKWENVGLGNTGETYLIGSDFKMRSISRFLIEDRDNYFKEIVKTDLPANIINLMKLRNTSIGLQIVKNISSKEALAGNTGYHIIKDYRGVEVLSAYAPIKINNINWAIISEIDIDEAFGARKTLLNRIIIVCSIVLIALLLVSIKIGERIARTISEPINSFCRLIKDIADSKDLTKRITINSNDELKNIANSLNNMLDSFQETFEFTISSTNEMKNTVERLNNIADNINENNISSLDSNDEINNTGNEIKKTSANLNDLSERLEKISQQFKIFEDKANKESDW